MSVYPGYDPRPDGLYPVRILAMYRDRHRLTKDSEDDKKRIKLLEHAIAVLTDEYIERTEWDAADGRGRDT